MVELSSRTIQEQIIFTVCSHTVNGARTDAPARAIVLGSATPAVAAYVLYYHVWDA